MRLASPSKSDGAHARRSRNWSASSALFARYACSQAPRQLAPIRRDDIQEFPRFQPPTNALQHVNPFGPALSEGPGDDWREQLGAAVEGLKVHKSHSVQTDMSPITPVENGVRDEATALDDGAAVHRTLITPRTVLTPSEQAPAIKTR